MRARPPYTRLEAALGTGLDPALLEQALTHRSYAYENGGLPTNERLEFLGDAVLGLVVTDGFTGNVLAKGLEAAAGVVRDAVLQALGTTAERRAALPVVLPALAEATDHMSPDAFGGAYLLGVRGVCVVGHGASSPQAVASCVGLAVQAVREGLVPRTAQALADLVAQRATVEP